MSDFDEWLDISKMILKCNSCQHSYVIVDCGKPIFPDGFRFCTFCQLPV
jgi:hypothetical protein